MKLCMPGSSKTCTTSARQMKRHKLLLCTAAAALSTRAWAFSVPASPLSRRSPTVLMPSTKSLEPPSTHFYRTIPGCSSSVRYMASGSQDGGGFLSKITDTVKSAAKSVLPASWFQSEEEKQRAIERKRIQNEVKGSIQEVLKDAPLPVKMLGSMFGPLMSSAMSSMADSLAEQQRTAEDYLSQARLFIQSDEAVTRIIGEPVQVGSPFSQSSSTSSINGKTTKRVELGFPVSGSRGSGVAQLSATEAGIQRLIVQAQGRQINVRLSARPNKFSGGGNDDDVIEAEIIEKNTRR